MINRYKIINHINYTYSLLAKKQVDSLLDKKEVLDNAYPRIIFPQSIWDSLRSLNNSLTDEVILEECRRINGDLSCLYPLKEPRTPDKPYLKDVPTTYNKECKKIRFNKINIKEDWWAIPLSIFIGLIISAILVGVIDFVWVNIAHMNQDGALLRLVYLSILSLSIIISFILLTFAVMVTTYYKPIPYEEQDLVIMRQKAQNEYEKALEKYPILLNEYTEQKIEYFNNVKRQRDIVSKSIPLIILSSLQSFFHESSSFSVVDEGPQRGRSENKLFASLMHTIPNFVHVDTTISGYYPDIMVSTCNNIYIDVEIDEPYDMATYKEIHYQGCEDEARNKRICDKGWFVVRFSERQIMLRCDVCVRIIQKLKKFIETNNIELLDSIIEDRELIREKCWTKEEARLMAINNYRNTY